MDNNYIFGKFQYNTGWRHVIICFFEEDGYLYIKLTNENLTSNILCLEQKGELVRSKPIEGDRDGGDFSSEDPFEITSPVSTPDSGQTTHHTAVPKPTATAAIIIPTTSVSSIPKKETTRTKKKKNSSSSQKSEGMITGITSSTEKSGSNTNTTTSMKKIRQTVPPLPMPARKRQ